MPMLPHPILGHYVWVKDRAELDAIIDRRRKLRGPQPSWRKPKRNSWRITMPDGRRLSLPQVTRETGIPESTLRRRYKRGETGADLLRAPSAPRVPDAR